jgi:WD40 repeat protein
VGLGSGRELRTLSGHTDWVYAVAVTLDGQRAVSASNDATLKVWELETGKLLAAFKCQADARCCAYFEKIIAGDGFGCIYILSVNEDHSDKA